MVYSGNVVNGGTFFGELCFFSRRAAILDPVLFGFAAGVTMTTIEDEYGAGVGRSAGIACSLRAAMFH